MSFFKCIWILEKGCLLMIGFICLTSCWCCWNFLGLCWLGTGVGVADSQFWKNFKNLFTKKFYVYCNIRR